MAYIPSIWRKDLPDDTIIAETAQAEFRLLKSTGRFSVYRNAAVVTVANTVVATNLFPPFTVPAGGLGTSNRIHIRIEGEYLNGNGGGLNQDCNLLIAFGGQTLGDIAVTLVYVPGQVGAWRLDVDFGNANAANAQEAHTEAVLFNAPSRNGGFNSSVAGLYGSSNLSTTVDTTAARVLSVTAQFALADPALVINAASTNIELY